MHLTRLKINALPGINPGFEFKPTADGVNIVTGPNASGKSSLVRALAHLLQPQNGDPPALSLEAHFDSNETGWQVRRNGGQVVWTRNGVPAVRPPLPAANQIGMYRLAMEHLLKDDQSDQEIAQELLRTLHGGFDLDQPRIDLKARFASADAKALLQAQKALKGTESSYATLRQQEEELPGLNAQIEAAQKAECRHDRLEQAIALHQAIRNRKAQAEKLRLLPPKMDQLLGNEVGLLEELEDKWRGLWDQLQQHQGELAEHQNKLEGTGLEKSLPKPDVIAANEKRLKSISVESMKRNNAEKDLAKAEAAVGDEIDQFNDDGLMPSLDTQSIARSEELAAPLVAAKTQKNELIARLKIAGDPPELLEINQCRVGISALRKWLAVTADTLDQSQEKSAWRSAWPLWIVLVSAVSAALAALLQDALAAMAGAVAAIAAAVWALIDGRTANGPYPSEQAKGSFLETNLEPPSDWIHATVRKRLLEIEDRLNGLLLQHERAANADMIRTQIEEVRETIDELNEQKAAFVREVGFDPEPPATALLLFVNRCLQLDKYRRERNQHKAEIERLDREITDAAKQVSEFVTLWQGGEVADYFTANGRVDIEVLTSSFDALKIRIASATAALGSVETSRAAIKSAQSKIEMVEGSITKLFQNAELAPSDLSTATGGGLGKWATGRRMLVDRINKMDEWKSAKNEFDKAQFQEDSKRNSLVDCPDLIASAQSDTVDELEAECDEAATEAAQKADLAKRHTEIQTRLKDAGSNHKLENALIEETQARAILEDRRDHAFLSEATNLLLDDVKQASQAEHEPEVLQRARELFREVTSHAFDFELGDDGQFLAHDLQQEAPRTLAELSSGTRMQLLLALRLAWIRTQERGTSPLPLFLDEALTTSDEDRFKVMAQSLERLSEAEGRQIFYLSARRHEPALWRQATGSQPAVADLAAIRFNAEGSGPDDYAVETAPPAPPPDSRTPEAYADLLGVPQYDPHTALGGIHLFHLLRDDLNLLHRLMDTWRIKSLGQLEYFLKSSAAQGAIGDVDHRQTLRNRCTAARHWVELWRQGRGKRVGRPALELSDAVTPVFIDRATDLVAELGGSGYALIAALRDGRLSSFRNKRINELEQWFDENGYIDNQPPLSADERRRLALQQTKPQSNTQAEDINQLIDWLEAAIDEPAQ